MVVSNQSILYGKQTTEEDTLDVMCESNNCMTNQNLECPSGYLFKDFIFNASGHYQTPEELVRYEGKPPEGMTWADLASQVEYGKCLPCYGYNGFRGLCEHIYNVDWTTGNEFTDSYKNPQYLWFWGSKLGNYRGCNLGPNMRDLRGIKCMRPVFTNT